MPARQMFRFQYREIAQALQVKVPGLGFVHKLSTFTFLGKSRAGLH
jgi:hypothetical protein